MNRDPKQPANDLQIRKRETMGLVVDCVAHDLNNLLTAILSFARFARDSLPEDSQARDDIGQVFTAALRASELTGHLSAFLREPAGGHTAIAVNPLVIGMARLLRRLVPENIELVTIPADEELVVRSDPGILKCLVAELILTARLRAGAGGKLITQVKMASAAGSGEEPVRVEIVVQPAATNADSLVPMPACQELASVAGAHLTVEDRGSDGIATVLELPRVAPDELTSPSGGLQLSSGQAGCPKPRRGDPIGTVLVVEDEPVVLGFTIRALEGAGFTTLSAGNGSEALRLSETHSGAIDLLISDVVMPQMNGPELASQLAELRPQMRVLYVSGYCSATQELQTAVGTRPLLPKPFTSQELLAKVDRVLTLQ